MACAAAAGSVMNEVMDQLHHLCKEQPRRKAINENQAGRSESHRRRLLTHRN